MCIRDRRNAFAHSSGIHQDGVLKNVQTYEIINPKDVGIDDNAIILTARSGHAALKHRLEVLGIDVSDDKLDRIYEAFLKLADQKKEITDDDVLVLAGAERSNQHSIKLDYLQVTSGHGVRPVAALVLDIAGEKFRAAAEGNGPVCLLYTSRELLKKNKTGMAQTVEVVDRLRKVKAELQALREELGCME